MPPGSGAAIGHRRGGYRPVLRDRVTRRLLTAKLVSEVGDFVGLAALLLLAYSASQSLLGTAAVLAARGLPALAVTTVLSGWLDRPPRRTALVFLALLGAFAIAIPTAIPTTATAITAAALLGAIRAAHRSIYVAVVAESVARPLRLPLFGLSAGINQTAQVVGLLAGASIALAIDVRASLLVDLVSFLVAAALLRRLPVTSRRQRPCRPRATDGIRIVWHQPTLRWLAVAAWATTFGGVLPEGMAPQVATSPAWTPIIMAGSAAGGAVFVLTVARGTFLAKTANQLRTAVGCGLAYIAAAVILFASGPDWAVALANAGVGAGLGWLAGAQATFATLAPAARMAQVEASMVAANIILGGLGILLLGQLAVATHPAYAYLVAGAVATLASALALRQAGSQQAPAPPAPPAITPPVVRPRGDRREGGVADARGAGFRHRSSERR